MFVSGKISLVLMILVMTLMILNSIVLYLLDVPWYFSTGVMIFLVGQNMLLNYETKSIIDRGLLEHNPAHLSKILPRTLSSLTRFHPQNLLRLFPQKVLPPLGLAFRPAALAPPVQQRVLQHPAVAARALPFHQAVRRARPPFQRGRAGTR